MGEHRGETTTSWGTRAAVVAGLGVLVLLGLAVFIVLDDRVADPSEEELVPLDWGADIEPDEFNLAYGPELGCPGDGSDHTCGGSQELDVYLRREGESRGTIIYFHGGGFQTGNKAPVEGLGNIKRQLERGFGLVSANYRLADSAAGENGFFDTIDDVGSAIRWVQREGPDHGLDTDVIIVAGGSAGGTLAGLAGTAANSDHPAFAELPTIDGWMSISGIMTWEGGPMSEGWIQGWLGDSYLELRDVAAVTEQLDRDDPPGYLAHGGSDGFVETANAGLLDEQVGILARLFIWRLRGSLTIDVVDNFADGEPMQENTGHTPLGGTNARVMNEWIDEVVETAAEDSGT